MKQNTPTTQRDNGFEFVFGKINYILLITGIVLLILGYILLSGGGSNDPEVFNPAMFNSRRLFVAPILIVAGLLVEIGAILYRGKNEHDDKQE